MLVRSLLSAAGITALSLLTTSEAAGWVSLLPSAEEVEAARQQLGVPHQMSVPKILPQTFVAEIPDPVAILGHSYQESTKAMLKSFDTQIGSAPVQHPEFFSLAPGVREFFVQHSNTFFNNWITQVVYMAEHDGATYLLTPSNRYTWVDEPSGSRFIFVWKWNTHSLHLVCIYKAARGLNTKMDHNLPRYKLFVWEDMRMLKLVTPTLLEQGAHSSIPIELLPDPVIYVPSSSSEARSS